MIPGETVKFIKGDITKIAVDAIVNAANSTLLGGGGVDGAIHRVAGPMLLEECRSLKGCAPGEAKITKGYSLPAKYVIHTVGPRWKGGQHGEEKILRSAYSACFKLLSECALSTIAFPSISTGAYGYPVDLASKVALEIVADHLASTNRTALSKITFVLFSDIDLATYLQNGRATISRY